MKPEVNLKLRKWALMTLGAIVWHVDEWLHRQELQLREEIASREATRETGRTGNVVSGSCVQSQVRHTGEPSRTIHQETFLEWEARKSGIAPTPKRQARRRSMPAKAFDLRFAR